MLQQKKTKESRSQSAPSIVNLGSSQVKFETQVKTAIVSPRKVKADTDIDTQVMEMEEVLLLHDEQLQVRHSLTFLSFYFVGKVRLVRWEFIGI